MEVKNKIKKEQLDLHLDSSQQDEQMTSEEIFVHTGIASNEEVSEDENLGDYFQNLNFVHKDESSHMKIHSNAIKLETDVKEENLVRENKLKIKEEAIRCAYQDDSAPLSQTDIQRSIIDDDRVSEGTRVTRKKTRSKSLKTLSCKFCNKTFKCRDELRSHLRINHKRRFKCSLCSYEGNQKVHLRRHMLTHSKIKLLRCSECNYECNEKGNLNRHMLIHSDKKYIIFKCAECDYGSNNKGNFERHKLKHGNVKLFKCSQCNYECNQKGSLNTHMLGHINIKLYRCPECSYACNQKGSLKIHMLRHAAVKLFKCTECSYECNQKVHLKRHLLTHVDTKLFKCSVCPHECNRKERFIKHLLMHGIVYNNNNNNYTQ